MLSRRLPLRVFAFAIPALLLTAGAGMAQVQRVTIRPQIAKLRPLAKEQEVALARVRAWSEGYLRNLPDYVCIQTTKRNAQPAGLDAWPITDVVRQAVTWSAHQETYEVLSVNGKPFNKELSRLGGNISTGEFGTLLDRLFSPESDTEFGWERRTTLRGVAVDVFAYRVSSAHGYTLYSGAQKYESAWEGLIYADHSNGAVLRIRMECIEIPMNFPVHHLNMTLDYGSARIGEREYMLPAHFELLQESSGGVTKRSADYGSYRKFETESSFTPLPDEGP